jgi:potassium efflux system protein
MTDSNARPRASQRSSVAPTAPERPAPCPNCPGCTLLFNPDVKTRPAERVRYRPPEPEWRGFPDLRLSSPQTPIAITLLLGLALATSGNAAELSLELVDSRLTALEDGGDGDETLEAYETARDWLGNASAFEQDAAQYVDALTSAPKQEAEIQARMDALETAEDATEVVEGLSREQLEANSTLARTELRDVTNSLDAIEQRLAARETSANQIQTRLQEITKRLAEIGSMETPIEPTGSPSMAEALEWISASERLSLMAERRAEEARRASQPVRFSKLRAERAELALRIEKLTVRKHALEAAVRSHTADETESAALAVPTDDPAYAISAELTEETARLRERLLEVETRLDEVRTDQEKVETATRALGERFSTARRMVDFASGSDVLGNLLLAYWQEIETFRLTDPTDRIPQQVGNTVISRIANEEALAELESAATYVNRRIEAAGLDPAAIPEASRKSLIELVGSKRELLRRIIAVESDQISALSELEASFTGLTGTLDEYEAYLGQLILWVPSHPVLWKSDPRKISADYSRLMSAVAELRVGIQPSLILALLLAGILAYSRQRILEAQHAQDRRLGSARDDSILSTVAALLLAALRALPGPLVVYAIGMLFSENGSPIATVVPHTIRAVFVALFALALARILCEESGVGRRHFGWSAETCQRTREEAGWLIRWWLPVAALASILFRLGDATPSLGRLVLLASLLVVAGHLGWHLRQERRDRPQRWLSTTANRVRLALLSILGFLVAAVTWGLLYSVGVIARNLLLTVGTGLALLILHSLLTRWLRVVRRRLRFEETLAARAARHAEHAAGDAGVVEEEQIDLVELGAETTELLNAATGTAGVLVLLYVWMPLLPAFDALSRIQLWSSSQLVAGETVTTQITLATLTAVTFLLSITFYAARKLPALVELVLRSRTELNPGARFTAITLLTYVIVGSGLFAALSALGLRWSELQWLVAALGVGIGFGLQEIIANFISGLIILFERPIRVGDAVTVGDKDGFVTKIRIRATTIRDWDGKELLVPNKEFITGRLLNWTLSDPQIRLAVDVGIAYGSDVERALRILREVVHDEPDVLDEPEPSIIFSAFGDNALELTARFFIGSMEERWAIKTRLHLEIFKRLGAAGIVIAFPQRDVHFDSKKPIRVAIDAPATE